MTDAPERIWLDWPAANKGDPVYDEPPERDTQPGQTEYIRADAARAEAEAMVRAEREAWTDKTLDLVLDGSVWSEPDGTRATDEWRRGVTDARKHIAAAIRVRSEGWA